MKTKTKTKKITASIIIILLFAVTLSGCSLFDSNKKDYDESDILTEFNENKNSEEYIEIGPENNILYDEAVDYMNNGEYQKAAEIFQESPDYKDSAELFELCCNFIKYNQAVIDFNDGKFDLAYNAFMELIELGGFLEDVDYVDYIDAEKNVEAGNYGEAAQKYYYLSTLSAPAFLDSANLYDKYACIYYDEQFQNGKRDFSDINLPINQDWRVKRRNNLWKHINASEILAEYYYKTDRSVSPVEVTGMGIYINDAWSVYGANYLGEQMFNDVPLFFIADSPEKVRYVVNFTQSAEKIGEYEVNGVPDGTFGYKTTTVATIKDTVTGQIIFYKSYTAEPPLEIQMNGDVYAEFDFLGLKQQGGGLSVYKTDILPVLKDLFEATNEG